MYFSSQYEVDNDVFAPLIKFYMDTKEFCSSWSNCDYISNFFAHMISHNRSDSVRHSNLFSSALNELLEVAFRGCHPGGGLTCRVSRLGEIERVELTFPCVSKERQLYEEAIAQLDGTGARERYLSSLSERVAPGPEMVLLELAIDYDAKLRLEGADANSVTLIVDLPLEGLGK